MTKIKLCGLTEPEEIRLANKLAPAYIGFVFAPQSRRYVTPQRAVELKKLLHPVIQAVGVFVNETPEQIAALCHSGVIDMIQLHGSETAAEIAYLRQRTGKPILKAFQISNRQDVLTARNSPADFVLLDSGGGSGTAFDWKLLQGFDRPFFLAGGLDAGNVRAAIARWQPYAVDVSSGIETDGKKDPEKMKAFVHVVREQDRKEETV